MEILAEVAIALVQFLAEILLQGMLELLAELGLQRIKQVFKRPAPTSPISAAIGYLILGAAAGWLSIYVVPTPFIQHPLLRAANLLATPVVSGVLMGFIGMWRQRKGQELIRLDRFTYGFLFAFGTAIVRFIWVGRG